MFSFTVILDPLLSLKNEYTINLSSCTIDSNRAIKNRHSKYQITEKSHTIKHNYKHT